MIERFQKKNNPLSPLLQRGEGGAKRRAGGSAVPAGIALATFCPASRAFLPLLALAVLLLAFLVPVPHVRGADDFPVYPCIQANVAFWEKIYSRYTTRQAVLHDANDLSRVYEVVELAEAGLPLANKLNQERVKLAKERVGALLERLAAGERPRTAKERKIAALFAGAPRSAYIRAKNNLRSQIGQKDRFYKGVVRSGKYMAHIRALMAREGLPPELAYLPHVESSFNPRAGSKAGAYGLWQFTRGTGKEYMTINSLVDERFDPFTASEAAAQFLRENYEALGSWPLALTAYNYGRAGMVRALNSHGSYEAIFQDYGEGYFKFASRNFYSEFLAAVRVAKRLEGVVSLDKTVGFKSYRLPSETALSELCAQHGLDQASFLRLNPALQAPVTSGKRKVPANYLVRVPGPVTAKTPAKIPAKVPARSAASSRTPQKTAGNGVASAGYLAYTVMPGDTLSAISRRFGVSSRVILRLNDKGPHNQVRVGDRLFIPQKR